MNPNKLKAKMFLEGYNITGFIKATGIKKSAMYRKLKRTSEFSCAEIKSIIDTLNLSPQETKDIFFN